jgi:heme A synthase
MLSGLSHAHSGLRWVAIGLLLFAIFNAFTRKNNYEKKDRLIYLFAMISLHVQLLIGLVLYFISDKVSFAEGWMKVGLYRFYGMEHLLGMLIAITLVTIGRKKSDKAIDPAQKHKIIRVWYTIGLIIIVAMIPWPFREALMGTWF